MTDNPYLVTVGASNAVPQNPDDDALLYADLLKTIGWLEESIAEYTELEGKIEVNWRWFDGKTASYPKYATYANIFNDQCDRAEALLARLHFLCEVGLGECDRLHGHKEDKKRFSTLETWVRQKRHEVSIANGEEF